MQMQLWLSLPTALMLVAIDGSHDFFERQSLSPPVAYLNKAHAD